MEWLVCAEYNALKNKGDVVVISINPDPTSKADLLHEEILNMVTKLYQVQM